MPGRDGGGTTDRTDCTAAPGSGTTAAKTYGYRTSHTASTYDANQATCACTGDHHCGKTDGRQ